MVFVKDRMTAKIINITWHCIWEDGMGMKERRVRGRGGEDDAYARGGGAIIGPTWPVSFGCLSGCLSNHWLVMVGMKTTEWPVETNPHNIHMARICIHPIHRQPGNQWRA